MGVSEGYLEEQERWRSTMETNLRAEDGWLALAGLFWLREGENSVGAGEDYDIALPVGSATGQIATLIRVGNQVHIKADPALGVMVNGEVVGERALQADLPGPPDLVTYGSLTFFIIIRGERIGVRLRDINHPDRQHFEGRIWYPVQPEYRVSGQLIPDATPQTVSIPNILGDIEEQETPGVIVFQYEGQELRLRPTSAGEKLFFIVRDATSGHDTYGVGRFLTSDGPKDGVVTLDFNRLYNPPCAFTPYATCPMPPKENHLSVAIAAGEKFRGH